jgi:type II secretory pathway predicted ATPase ExeA
MLIAQQPLTTDARKHFRLFVGPFDDEVLLDAHFFTNDQIRLVREMVWQTALNARMLALVGESGSGKTTILADLKERIAREAKPMRVIAPSVAAMAEKDDRGKPLKSSDILATMVMALDERATVAQTSEARKRQVLRLLGESAKAGYAHLLVIEEAHDAPRATLNQLKRLYEEMRTTRQPLLSVLLLGHPELADKLQKHDVREVLQRMAIVELPPLNVKAGELLAYMRHRVKAYCGRELEELFDAGAVAALANRLQGDVYPLAINNLANRALNKAAELGAPFVTADVAVMP